MVRSGNLVFRFAGAAFLGGVLGVVGVVGWVCGIVYWFPG